MELPSNTSLWQEYNLLRRGIFENANRHLSSSRLIRKRSLASVGRSGDSTIFLLSQADTGANSTPLNKEVCTIFSPASPSFHRLLRIELINYPNLKNIGIHDYPEVDTSKLQLMLEKEFEFIGLYDVPHQSFFFNEIGGPGMEEYLQDVNRLLNGYSYDQVLTQQYLDVALKSRLRIGRRNI